MKNEIEEMFNIANSRRSYITDIDGNTVGECKPTISKACETLYHAGYRKQSNTVKEFAEKLIEDIEQAIDSNKKVMDKRGYGDSYLTCLGKVIACQGIIDKINELSAEYGVEVEK